MMAHFRASSPKPVRSSIDAENQKLMGYEGNGDSSSDSESVWNPDDNFRPSRRAIPTPSSLKGWLFLLLLVIATSSLAATLAYTFKPRCTEQECVRMTSSYSPLLEAVEYRDYQFEAELGVENVYKGHPRPELDAAWTRVGKIHPISMPEKYREVLNKTHSGVPYPEEKGGGIMVEIEVFHQLHCLNFLRKVIYADYYSRPENFPITFGVSDELFFNHIDHCVDYLRQFIMCASDVTPVTSNWVHGHHSPHPDFNTMHKCRNFDKLLEWVEEKDNGGVPKQSPNPSWWPRPSLATTILDYEPGFPVPPHGAPVDDADHWTKNQGEDST